MGDVVYILRSNLPDDPYLWDLYAACIATEQILKKLGHKTKEDKQRRRELEYIFLEKDCERLESRLASNLGAIESADAISLNTAPYFRRLKELEVGLSSVFGRYRNIG